MAQLFGFQITKTFKDKENNYQVSFSLNLMTEQLQHGFYSEYLDLDGTGKNEYELIRRYQKYV